MILNLLTVMWIAAAMVLLEKAKDYLEDIEASFMVDSWASNNNIVGICTLTLYVLASAMCTLPAVCRTLRKRAEFDECESHFADAVGNMYRRRSDLRSERNMSLL